MTTRYFICLIVLMVALASLGVQTAILTVVFAVILISLGIAAALALGSRAVVANILAGALVRDHFPEGREIEVLGIRGKVVAVNSVGTTVEAEGKTITVPNAVLMEHVVE